MRYVETMNSSQLSTGARICTLGTLSLLMSEIYIDHLNTYSSDNVYLDLTSFFIFGGIALGNVLGFPFRKLKFDIDVEWLLTGVLHVVAFWGMIYFRKFAPILLSLPFIGFGICLTTLFSRYTLKMLIICLNIAGLMLLVFYFFIVKRVPEYLPLIVMLLPLLTSLQIRSSYKFVESFKYSILVLVVIFFSAGAFEPKPHVSYAFAPINTSEKVSEPRFNLLFRTDLYTRENGDYFYVIDGRKFAWIPRFWLANKILGNDPIRPHIHNVPYFFFKPEKVLVIGCSEGKNVLTAIRGGAKNITALDINPHVFDIFREDLAGLGKLIYFRPEVKTVVAEGRHFISSSQEKYDLITLQGVQSGNTISNISTVKIESHLFTKESLIAMWNALSDDGMLFFDEYTLPNMYNVTFLQQLLYTAREAIPLEDFEAHVFYYGYEQHGDYIELSSQPGARSREGFILSKKPISIAPVKTFLDQGFFQQKPIPTANDNIKPLTDNTATFTHRDLAYLPQWYLGLALLSVLILIYLGWKWFGRGNYLSVALPLSLTGVGYMFFVAGLASKIFIWLGHPAYVVCTLYSPLCHQLVGWIMVIEGEV